MELDDNERFLFRGIAGLRMAVGTVFGGVSLVASLYSQSPSETLKVVQREIFGEYNGERGKCNVDLFYTTKINLSSIVNPDSAKVIGLASTSPKKSDGKNPRAIRKEMPVSADYGRARVVVDLVYREEFNPRLNASPDSAKVVSCERY